MIMMMAKEICLYMSLAEKFSMLCIYYLSHILLLLLLEKLKKYIAVQCTSNSLAPDWLRVMSGY